MMDLSEEVEVSPVRTRGRSSCTPIGHMRLILSRPGGTDTRSDSVESDDTVTRLRLERVDHSLRTTQEAAADGSRYHPDQHHRPRKVGNT